VSTELPEISFNNGFIRISARQNAIEYDGKGCEVYDKHFTDANGKLKVPSYYNDPMDLVDNNMGGF
jgi:hypothetical protein